MNEELEYRRALRRDTDRLIIGTIYTLIIATIWLIVLMSEVESRLADALLGATVPIETLIVQFYFRSSGDKK